MSAPGIFTPPQPVNEPAKSYAPGTPERVELQARLRQMESERIRIPLVIGGQDVETPETFEAVMPHRTSHVLADAGRVWLVDPVDWQPGLERAATLGEPAAVLQLLDRHNRDCAALAARLGVPHLVAPPTVPDSPFEVIEVKRSRRWQEIALWWPEQRTLVIAEAVGTNDFYTGGRGAAGVHLLLRPTPPRRQLAAFEPDHLLVGHGEGIHGPSATTALRGALADARRGLPRVLARVPALVADARRRRRS